MSKQHDVRYKFYPSILDRFTKYLTTTPEEYFYQDETGAWHRNYNDETGECVLSVEEVDARLKKELIDAINRVPCSSVAMSKGTAFNEVVDSFVHNVRSERVAMKGYKDEDRIEVECDGNVFNFSYRFIESVADYFTESLSQVLTEAVIDTKFGEVLLYGYIDELRRDKVYDIKTTSSTYKFGQYEKYWQRHVYPYCLVESGQCTDIDSFEFTCFQLKGGTSRSPLITGTIFPETYNYNHAQSTEKLKGVCEQFIEFLNANKESITDKKIFAND